MLLPPEIPLFPLPNVVLFPQVGLPLHIFEPRYREMVAEALAGDRLIGMVLLRPGFEAEYENRPPVYPVGCAGLITHAEPLSDGRYNIVLQGLERFRVHAEQDGRSFRKALVEPLADPVDAQDASTLREIRQRLEALIAPLVERAGADMHVPASIPDVEIINALAQYLPLEPLEKQALLEREGPLARGRSLVELLEMKALMHKACAASKLAH
jgi:Lon protease-like protein